MTDTASGSRGRRRIGSRILIALAITWALAILLSVALFGVPHLIPNCTLGGKTTTVQCGALTSFFNSALEAYFSLGLALLIVSVPWLAVGLVVVVVEAIRAKASA
jgi:hypothetical protein